jgi:flagellar assembly protein FliH
MNVINKEHVEEHSVQRYRFKVLGSNVADAQTMDDSQDDVFEEKLVPVAEALIPHDELPKSTRVDEGHHLFVEELLKKTDELSTNVVKLQLQIEKQEGEFNNRLNDELKRERENSHTQGYQKAKEELETSLADVKSRYLKSIGQMETFVQTLESRFVKMESEMSTTAFEIAKEVIKKEVSHASGNIAIALAKELLKEVKEASKIELKVNPKDLETLKEVYAANEKIKVSADDAITLGGVVILSDGGNLDGTLAMRLEKVKYLIQENES